MIQRSKEEPDPAMTIKEKNQLWILDFHGQTKFTLYFFHLKINKTYFLILYCNCGQ